MSSNKRIARVAFNAFCFVQLTLAATAVTFAASENSKTPIEIIRSIYGEFARGHDQNGLERYFTPGLKDRYQQERRCEEKIQDQRNAGPLWWSGQDYKITGVAVTKADGNDGEQRVVAQFKNMGEPQSRTFLFVKLGNGWRVDDVMMEGRSLRAAMTAPCS